MKLLAIALGYGVFLLYEEIFDYYEDKEYNITIPKDKKK